MKNISIKFPLNSREKALVIVLCAALIIGIFFKYGYRRVGSNLRKAKASYVKASNELSSSLAQLPDLELERAKLERAKRKNAVLAKKLSDIEAAVPTKLKLNQPSLFLKELAGSPQKYNMDILSVRPHKLEAKSGELYAKMEVEMNLTLPFTGLIDYLKNIYALSDYLKVTSLEVMIDEKVSANPFAQLKMETVLGDWSEGTKGAPKKDVIVQEGAPSSVDPFKAPFSAKAKRASMKEFQITGILWKGGSPIAIVNGQTVKVGDMVNGKKVAAILSNEVILEDEEEQYELKFGKEENRGL